MVCRQGLERHPTYSTARFILAKTLLDRDEVVAARGELERFLQVEPEHEPALRLAVECALRLADPLGALTHLGRLGMLDPDDRVIQGQLRALEVAAGRGRSGGEAGAFWSLLADDTYATVTLGDLCIARGCWTRRRRCSVACCCGIRNTTSPARAWPSWGEAEASRAGHAPRSSRADVGATGCRTIRGWCQPPAKDLRHAGIDGGVSAGAQDRAGRESIRHRGLPAREAGEGRGLRADEAQAPPARDRRGAHLPLGREVRAGRLRAEAHAVHVSGRPIPLHEPGELRADRAASPSRWGTPPTTSRRTWRSRWSTSTASRPRSSCRRSPSYGSSGRTPACAGTPHPAAPSRPRSTDRRCRLGPPVHQRGRRPQDRYPDGRVHRARG